LDSYLKAYFVDISAFYRFIHQERDIQIRSKYNYKMIILYIKNTIFTTFLVHIFTYFTIVHVTKHILQYKFNLCLYLEKFDFQKSSF